VLYTLHSDEGWARRQSPGAERPLPHRAADRERVLLAICFRDPAEVPESQTPTQSASMGDAPVLTLG